MFYIVTSSRLSSPVFKIPSSSSRLSSSSSAIVVGKGDSETVVRVVKTKPDISCLAELAEDEELYERFSSVDVIKESDRVAREISRKKQSNVQAVMRRMRRAQRVTLCFLLDTTGSMSGHITGVKENILQIVKNCQKMKVDLIGIAFVGYKDWEANGTKHEGIEILDFTTDLPKFQDFVGKIQATGGGDTPEDVLGGIHASINHLNWPEESLARIIFHFADAPAHGRQFQSSDLSDNFPNGHPQDPSAMQLFREMKEKNISYYFGQINASTDVMIQKFSEYYGQPITSMFVGAGASLDATIVETVTLGIKESVNLSMATASRFSSKSRLMREYKIVESEPDFDHLEEVYVTLISHISLPTVLDIVEGKNMETETKDARLKMSKTPFAKGAERYAFYARQYFDHGETDEIVLKEFISVGVSNIDRFRYLNSMETQTIALALAEEFNKALKTETSAKIKFLRPKVAKISSKYYAYEKRYRNNAKHIKFTNNLNYVLDEIDKVDPDLVEFVVAYSHFTFEITNGYLLVNDLQGILTGPKEKEVLLLTDPAIHCYKSSHRFGSTNLGAEGMQAFFQKHSCNQYCKYLGLSIPRFETSK